MAQRREEWRGRVMPTIDPSRVVFLDETGARTDLTRTHGYAPRAQRMEAEVPHRRWQSTKFVGSMRSTGFVAPLVVDGAYVRRVLAPALRRGDVVVMDNLACHKRAGVRQAIEAAGGTLLFVPPHSPDCNPIELAFSKLKQLMRKAAARTAKGLWLAIGSLLDRFSLRECLNYMRHAGYPATSS